MSREAQLIKPVGKGAPRRRAFKRLAGWLLAVALLMLLLVGVWLGTYPFLARNVPIASDVLVVEGWVNDLELEEAMAWAATNHVKRIYATGGPFPTGSLLLPWGTYANMTLERMKLLAEQNQYSFEMEAVPAPDTLRDRTQVSAKALKLRDGLVLRDFNLATSGTHARRSWRIFRDYFAPDVRVGIISLQPPSHNATDWWKSSDGVRTVTAELIAYVYDLLNGKRD